MLICTGNSHDVKRINTALLNVALNYNQLKVTINLVFEFSSIIYWMGHNQRRNEIELWTISSLLWRSLSLYPICELPCRIEIVTQGGAIQAHWQGYLFAQKNRNWILPAHPVEHALSRASKRRFYKSLVLLNCNPFDLPGCWVSRKN